MDGITMWMHLGLLGAIGFAILIVVFAVLWISIFLEFRSCFKDMLAVIKERTERPWKSR